VLTWQDELSPAPPPLPAFPLCPSDLRSAGIENSQPMLQLEAITQTRSETTTLDKPAAGSCWGKCPSMPPLPTPSSTAYSLTASISSTVVVTASMAPDATSTHLAAIINGQKQAVLMAANRPMQFGAVARALCLPQRWHGPKTLVSPSTPCMQCSSRNLTTFGFDCKCPSESSGGRAGGRAGRRAGGRRAGTPLWQQQPTTTSSTLMHEVGSAAENCWRALRCIELHKAKQRGCGGALCAAARMGASFFWPSALIRALIAPPFRLYSRSGLLHWCRFQT